MGQSRDSDDDAKGAHGSRGEAKRRMLELDKREQSEESHYGGAYGQKDDPCQQRGMDDDRKSKSEQGASAGIRQSYRKRSMIDLPSGNTAERQCTIFPSSGEKCSQKGTQKPDGNKGRGR